MVQTSRLSEVQQHGPILPLTFFLPMSCSQLSQGRTCTWCTPLSYCQSPRLILAVPCPGHELEVGNLVLIPGRVSSRDLVGASLPHGLWQGPRLPSPCSRTLFRIRLHCVHDQNSLPSPGQVLGAGEAAAGRCTSCYPRCQGCLSPWVLVRAGREGLTCRVGEASHPSAFVCPLLRVGGTQADTTPSPPG